MSSDIQYDYRKDSKCGDPDVDSPKLYDALKNLWSKNLPDNTCLELTVIKKGRFLLRNNITDNLSSDRMCPHFVGRYNGKLSGWLTASEEENLQYKVRTLGGHIIFPAHKNGGFTVNQARGVNRKICDRFDLTLECIRRFYQKENSPLSKSLGNYKSFFDLFVDFKKYTDFFYLQDFINQEGKVLFTLPFDNFNRSPLPQNEQEYREYMQNTIKAIDKRNNRIASFI